MATDEQLNPQLSGDIDSYMLLAEETIATIYPEQKSAHIRRIAGLAFNGAPRRLPDDVFNGFVAGLNQSPLAHHKGRGEYKLGLDVIHVPGLKSTENCNDPPALSPNEFDAAIVRFNNSTVASRRAAVRGRAATSDRRRSKGARNGSFTQVEQRKTPKKGEKYR